MRFNTRNKSGCLEVWDGPFDNLESDLLLCINMQLVPALVATLKNELKRSNEGTK